MEQLKDRLRAAMKRTGITQTELAKRINISQSNIAFILSGRNKTTKSDILANMADVLGVSVAYLMGVTPELSKSADAAPVYIPYYDSIPIKDQETGKYSFKQLEKTHVYPRDFMDKNHLNKEKCKLFKVLTDTLEPLINEGDSILVNCEDIEPWKHPQAHIYAYVVNDVLQINRIVTVFDEIRIEAINNKYSPLAMSKEKFLSQAQIIGRVIDRFGYSKL